MRENQSITLALQLWNLGSHASKSCVGSQNASPGACVFGFQTKSVAFCMRDGAEACPALADGVAGDRTRDLGGFVLPGIEWVVLRLPGCQACAYDRTVTMARMRALSHSLPLPPSLPLFPSLSLSPVSWAPPPISELAISPQ